MSELCRFEGIIIYLYYEDIEGHSKPHVHVVYGEHEASLTLDGDFLAGTLPHKQEKRVKKWISLHEEELYKAWNLAVRNQHFDKIPPLN